MILLILASAMDLLTWLFIILAALGLVIGVLFIVDWLFGENMTVEAVDPQELLDSDFNMRDAQLTAFINVILSHLEATEEDVNLQNYQPEINRMIIVLTVADTRFTIVADWNKYIYEVTASKFDQSSKLEMIISELKKTFKMNKKTYEVSYVKMHKFLSKYDNLSLTDASVSSIMGSVAEVARMSELDELTDTEKDRILFSCLTDMTYMLDKKKFGKDKRFIALYSGLMTYLCAKGKRLEYVDYLKEDADAEPVHDENEKEEEM